MLVTQSYLTLCKPMDCNLPASSTHGIFQVRTLEWAAISFSRGSSWPRDRTQVSCTAGRLLTIWATREAWVDNYLETKHLYLKWHIDSFLIKNLERKESSVQEVINFAKQKASCKNLKEHPPQHTWFLILFIILKSHYKDIYLSKNLCSLWSTQSNTWMLSNVK